MKRMEWNNKLELQGGTGVIVKCIFWTENTNWLCTAISKSGRWEWDSEFSSEWRYPLA